MLYIITIFSTLKFKKLYNSIPPRLQNLKSNHKIRNKKIAELSKYSF